MENIIETLYTYLPRPQVPEDSELEELKKEYRNMSDMLKAQYGPDFMDRFSALRDRLNQRSWEREFSLGFRTCAQLMLEALRPD